MIFEITIYFAGRHEDVHRKLQHLLNRDETNIVVGEFVVFIAGRVCG